MNIESISLQELAINISEIIKLYAKGGNKEEIGKTSNRIVINALKGLKKYLDEN